MSFQKEFAYPSIHQVDLFALAFHARVACLLFIYVAYNP